MIYKKLIDYISEKKKITRRELIEKDLLLHEILLFLSKNKNFKEKYAFKGGTCLIKAYFDYYRFSEDLDFTFINQELFKNKSKNQIRKLISKELELIINLLKNHHEDINLKFEPDKSNQKFFEFGAGNIFTTIKLHYTSLETKQKSFIKIQFNFIEKLFYPINLKKLNNILNEINMNELEILFPEEIRKYNEQINLNCYDLNEILLEKIRAILTRKGFKARDFIDIYKITNGDLKRVEPLIDRAVKKTQFSLSHEKYEENIKQKKNQQLYTLGEEEALLLEPVKKDFYEFIKELEKLIQKIIKKHF